MTNVRIETPRQQTASVWTTAQGLARRGLVLGSAVLVALVISGAIFTFTPLIGLKLAHTNGISMEPEFKQGDLVLIRDVNGEDVGLGDIVVFEAIGQQVMHRVIELRPGPGGDLYLVTQGDNVADPDIPIHASQVTGKLVAEVPLLGALSRLIDAEGGYYVYRSAILTMAVAAVAIWGLTASVRQRRKAMVG